jgi:hypothetical protein
MSEFEKWEAAIRVNAEMRHLRRQLAAARTNAQKTRLESEISELAARIAKSLAAKRPC